MASGTITGATSGWSYCKITWSSSKGNGGSTVSATTYICHTARYNYNSRKPSNITINGVAKNASTLAGGAVNGTGVTCAAVSNSVWVGYTGNKSITISGYVDLSSVSVSSGGKVGVRSASGTATLDKVGSVPTTPTMIAPTTAIISETSDSITVRWNASSSYNNSGTYHVDVSINGGAYTYVSGDLAWGTTSWTYNISNKTQGTTYKFQVSCGNDIGWSGHSESGVVTLNSLSSPTIGDIATYNPYVTSTLSVALSGGSQLNGEAFKRYASLYYGDTLLANCSTPSDNNNTSVSISYSAANFIAKLGSNKYTDNFKIVAWIQNGNGTKSSVVEKTFIVNINSDGGATPTLNAPTFSGGILNNPSTCFVAGINAITITSGSGALRRAPSGTTLTYTIHVSGAYSVGGNTATFDNLTAGTHTTTVTVRDSRGLETSVTKQFVVQSYSSPTIKSLVGARLDNPNTSGKATYTLSYSPIYQYTDVNTKGNQLNGINVQQINKNNGDYSNYTSGTTITGLDTGTSYKIGLRITDKVKTSNYITSYTTIPTIVSGLSIRKWGIGIQCIPQNGYALDVNGNIRLNNSISNSLNTSSYVNGSSGRAIINSTNSAGGYTAFLKGNSTNGAFTLSTYKDVVRIGYQSNDSINAGTNSLTKYIDILQEDGSSVFNNIKASNEIHVGSTFGAGEGTIQGIGLFNDGHIELSGSTPYIDFHYNNSSDDYTYRILASANGLKMLSPYSDNHPDDILTTNKAFPVGAVYITYNNNNPSNFLGGTWVQFGQGRVLIGQGEGNDGSTSMSFTSTNTYGEYKHTITANEMPSHAHDSVWQNANTGNQGTSYGSLPFVRAGGQTPGSQKFATTSIGGGESHNNIQPSICVYFWRRTA